MYIHNRHFEGHVHCTLCLDSEVVWYDQMAPYISGNVDQYVARCFNGDIIEIQGVLHF